MVFGPALAEMADGQAVWGPRSFRDYVAEHSLPAKGAPPHISVDSFERLAQDLRHKDCMVLRLGSSTGTGTQFALVRLAGRLQDFFLVEDDVFEKGQGQIFLPTMSIRSLYGYQVLPVHTETSMVNLGLASGLLSEALRLDDKGGIVAPATGRSTFTFDVRPHSSLSDVVFRHESGQVEIDAIFIGRRDGQETLFILEAKTGRESSLAKHKLVYPLRALGPSVPADLPIVPVYVRIRQAPDGFHYHVLECEYPDPRTSTAGIDELVPRTYSHLVMPLFCQNR